MNHLKIGKLYTITLASILALSLIPLKPAFAAPNPYLGELMLVGFNFCPVGWAPAEGQLLAISSNTALFSLFGTTYGGDGRSTFALPDLRGRVPRSAGTGPGLSPHPMGESAGTETTTLTINNMPSHNHDIRATNSEANKGGPAGKFLAAATPPQTGLSKYHEGPANKTMNTSMVTNSGGGQSFSNKSPYLTLQWCVALVGTYPSRN